jgi:hypothetical protein
MNTQETISQYVRSVLLAERIVRLSHLIKEYPGDTTLNTICPIGDIIEENTKREDLNFLLLIKNNLEEYSELVETAEARLGEWKIYVELMKIRDEIRAKLLAKN